ncbi:hypothetical protein [Pontibacter sp. G13]|uniref:hypothetical protein n=1 Tax=Pontibacter sp. G13 TaxID=3074898 RepID=UPI00288BE27D|nr:hypothetical protein [Pontibacter sp. G13]WNJ19471.1 hypothetical protein RJD25_03170 [Pontibacter sp. G13]
MKLLLIILTLACAVLPSCRTNRWVEAPKAGAIRTFPNDRPFLLTEISDDPTYGYSQHNPIMVGGVTEGPKNERRFLLALTGPQGEKVSYHRVGSCCPFKSSNAPLGKGLLDMYEVSWEGSSESTMLYLNMYDAGPLKAPKGFGIVAAVD